MSGLLKEKIVPRQLWKQGLQGQEDFTFCPAPQQPAVGCSEYQSATLVPDGLRYSRGWVRAQALLHAQDVLSVLKSEIFRLLRPNRSDEAKFLTAKKGCGDHSYKQKLNPSPQKCWCHACNFLQRRVWSDISPIHPNALWGALCCRTNPSAAVTQSAFPFSVLFFFLSYWLFCFCLLFLPQSPILQPRGYTLISVCSPPPHFRPPVPAHMLRILKYQQTCLFYQNILKYWWDKVPSHWEYWFGVILECTVIFIQVKWLWYRFYKIYCSQDYYSHLILFGACLCIDFHHTTPQSNMLMSFYIILIRIKWRP